MEHVLAAVRVGPGKTEIREFPMPDIPPDGALLKMEVAGICGTDVEQYRGVQRLWLVSGGSRPYRSARAAVRDYLATIGVRRDSLVLASLTREGIWLDLYDLSDTVRLRSANAESFPVAPMPKDPRPGCRPWVKPSPLDSLR